MSYGRWPEKYDEVVLVVDKNNEVSDLVLYALGLKSNSTLSDDMEAFMAQENLRTDKESWTYRTFAAVPSAISIPPTSMNTTRTRRNTSRSTTRSLDSRLCIKTALKSGSSASSVRMRTQCPA